MKKLIINADDFGLCESVNQGILEGFRSGLISDLSFMYLSSNFENSVKLLKNENLLKTGIHFNITCGRSITGKIKGITNNKGLFLDFKNILVNNWLNKIDIKKLYLELESQLVKLLDENIEVTHIDSHQNIHIIPVVYETILELKNKYNLNIPLRYPFQKLDGFYHFKTSNQFRIVILNIFSQYLKIKKYPISNINSTGGDFFNNEQPSFAFNHMLNQIRNSNYTKFEIPVHPGYNSSELEKLDSYTKQRQGELAFLKSLKKSDINNDIKIVSFKELV